MIPQRTRRHRAEKNQRLTVDEFDRAVRLARVQTLAEEAFGDNDKANLWLRRPLTELRGKSPLDDCSDRGGRACHRDHPRQDRMGCGCLMLLWWLSGLRHANAFDGGYGLLFDGDGTRSGTQ